MDDFARNWLEYEWFIGENQRYLEKRATDNQPIKAKQILLPDNPRENWHYKGRKLNPIFLPGQYK